MIRGFRRWQAGACAAGLAVVALLAAPPVFADGLGGITGFEPAPDTCGIANMMPVVATNATNVPQTLTLQVPAGGMAEQVRYMTSVSQFVSECPQRDGTGVASTNTAAWTQSITVQPGTSATFYLSLGGVDYNLIGGNAFAIQGGPSMDGTTSAVIAQLNLGADEQFKSLSTTYNFLGSSMEPGFNLFACNTTQPSAGENIFVTSQVLTPYASVTTSGPTYGSGEPMCMGWLPVGTYVSPSLSNFPDAEVLAVVTNASGLPPGEGYPSNVRGQVINTSVAIQLPSGFDAVAEVYLEPINQASFQYNESALEAVGVWPENYIYYSYPFTQIEDVLILESIPVYCGGNIAVTVSGVNGAIVSGTIGIGSGAGTSNCNQ